MAHIPPHYLDGVVAVGTKRNEVQEWVGTGFLFGLLTSDSSNSEKSYHTYLVTNKHVLRDLDNVVLRFNSRTGLWARDFCEPLSANGRTLWTGHPDEDVDVAVMPINTAALDGEALKHFFFQSDRDAAVIEDLRGQAFEGDFIYALGYPMGITAEDRQDVIVRSGVISRIQDLFEGRKKDFVIDAPIFPGNSGGPVILKTELHGIVGTVPHKEARLVGMVKAYIPYNDVAVSRQTGATRVVFQENSGLTIVEPVDHIIQTINHSNMKQV